MKSIKVLFLSSFLILFATPVAAALNIFTCEPEWNSLVQELGGERVKSYSATTAYQDPHHIEARPSLIAKVRRADLIICSGAELEIGWLPLLLRQASNNKVLPGTLGHFEAAAMVQRLEIPQKLDRSQGDVHASGNPHVHLDPRRIAIIAKALTERLIKIDNQGKILYQNRFNDFNQRWQNAILKWQAKAKPLVGKNIIVHHRDWVYLFDWLNINIAGALEPKPGLPTTIGHLSKLKQSLDNNSVSMIIYTAHQNPRSAKRFSKMTQLPAIQLPYTVGGHKKVTDLFSLFDVTLDKMLAVLP